MVHFDECQLCQDMMGGKRVGGKRGQRGGSQASDAVTSLINCDTWDALNSMQSNLVPSPATAIDTVVDSFEHVAQEGGKQKVGKKCRRRALIGRRKAQKGGSCDSQPMDVLLPYVSLNPATVPLSTPTQGLENIDYGQVNASTLTNLAQPIGGFGIVDTTVSVPAGVPNMTTV